MDTSRLSTFNHVIVSLLLFLRIAKGVDESIFLECIEWWMKTSARLSTHKKKQTTKIGISTLATALATRVAELMVFLGESRKSTSRRGTRHVCLPTTGGIIGSFLSSIDPPDDALKRFQPFCRLWDVFRCQPSTKPISQIGWFVTNYFRRKTKDWVSEQNEFDRSKEAQWGFLDTRVLDMIDVMFVLIIHFYLICT